MNAWMRYWGGIAFQKDLPSHEEKMRLIMLSKVNDFKEQCKEKRLTKDNSQGV